MSDNKQKGFTLLEILLVVAAIAILAGIVIVALNPSKQLGDTKNAQRSSDVTTILNAVYQYAIDNNGQLPADIDNDEATYQVIGTDTTGLDTTCTAVDSESRGLDLTTILAPVYVVSMPLDPATGTEENTDYYINRNDNGRVTVGSCDPEQGAVIEVTR